MTDLRTIERESIRAFVQSAADGGYLSGRVLDYGCGKQPYRDIVEAAGGEYHGMDAPTYPGSVVDEYVHPGFPHRYNSTLCTQVLQYVSDPGRLLKERAMWTTNLILTYPTTWPEVEEEDLHRFTKAGMERLLTEAGFEIVRHERRAVVYGTPVDGIATMDDELALGYGCIARA